MSHEHLCPWGHPATAARERERRGAGATSRGVCTQKCSGFAFQHRLLPGSSVPLHSWDRIQPRVPRLRGLGSAGVWEAEGGDSAAQGWGLFPALGGGRGGGCISALGRGVMERLPVSPLGSGHSRV